MEFLLPSSTILIACIFAFLPFLYYLLHISRIAHRNTLKKKIAAPEAAGAWPVIGHLHLLGKSSQQPHITLGNMADKYGPIFTIKLGVHPALRVSNWEMAKECFTTNDKAFANRSKLIATELLGYNYATFAFSSYGPYWRQLRKIATVELFTNHRLQMLQRVQESEVRSSIKGIYEQWVKKNDKSGSADKAVVEMRDKSGPADKVVVEMRQWFGDITLNVVMRTVVGKRYTADNASEEDEERARCQKALRDFFNFFGLFIVSDAIPFLRWLDLGGHEAAMKKTAKELDRVLEGWLEEHKRSRISGQVKEEQDFMDVMLSILDDGGGQELSGYDADTINKATCLVLILAATDTTAVTLTWVLSLLLNNRDVLKKAYDELDIHIGKDKKLKELDLKNLVYLQAIIKETMRYILQRHSQQHMKRDPTVLLVATIFLLAHARLLVNLYKIHRDPRVWFNPCKFQPERFLTTHKDVDVKGQHFELMPFSSGRRRCPRISYALQVLQFTLASLLHGFEITTPLDEPVDMSGSIGLTNFKDTRLQVLLTPRLPSNLYT